MYQSHVDPFLIHDALPCFILLTVSFWYDNKLMANQWCLSVDGTLMTLVISIESPFSNVSGISDDISFDLSGDVSCDAFWFIMTDGDVSSDEFGDVSGDEASEVPEEPSGDIPDYLFLMQAMCQLMIQKTYISPETLTDNDVSGA